MKYFIRTVFIGMIIGLILFIVDLVIRHLSGIPFTTDVINFKSLFFYMLYSVPLCIVNSYFFDWLNGRLVWKKLQKYRLFLGLVGSIIISLTTYFLIRIMHRVTINGTPFNEFIATEELHYYFIALLITLVIALFFHALYFYKTLQENRVKEQKVIAGTASAKFESLKNQIDPHFLFNSLNVLTSLIEENPDNAQRFTTSLSKVYRYVLEQKDKELVSVEEELAFAKTYMELLTMRFENSLFYDVPQNLENPEAKVVPLSLQLLLENAIKHNAVSEGKPLHIKIFEEGNNLVIENNLQKKEVLQNRRGVGLQNIINRYHLVTNRKVIVDENQTTFQVKIPVLTQRITVMETYRSNENTAYYKAKARVKEIKEFYGNLLSYCIVIPFLIFINYRTYWEFQWFWFPLFGWGLGLTIHAFTVFGYGANWEERKIEEIMRKNKEQNKSWK